MSLSTRPSKNHRRGKSASRTKAQTEPTAMPQSQRLLEYIRRGVIPAPSHVQDYGESCSRPALQLLVHAVSNSLDQGSLSASCNDSLASLPCKSSALGATAGTIISTTGLRAPGSGSAVQAGSQLGGPTNGLVTSLRAPAVGSQSGGPTNGLVTSLRAPTTTKDSIRLLHDAGSDRQAKPEPVCINRCCPTASSKRKESEQATGDNGNAAKQSKHAQSVSPLSVPFGEQVLANAGGLFVSRATIPRNMG